MVDINKAGAIQSNYYSKKANRQIYLYNYYIGKDCPVYARRSVSPLKEATHTNMHINFFSDIINRKVGYAGQNIDFDINKSLAGDKYDEYVTLLKQFERDTKQKTMNSASWANTSIQGISHRLCYTQNGVFKTKNLLGEQVVYDYDNDIYDPEAAYYYYRITDLEGEYEDRCDVYTRTEVYYLVRQKEEKKPGVKTTQGSSIGGNYIMRPMEQNPQPHNFNQVPIIPFINNEDWSSDCDDSVEIMDAYDEIISDTTGELKAARLAYLKIYGDLYTGQREIINSDGVTELVDIPIPDYLREFGTLLFGTGEDGQQHGDAAFLEKKIDDTAIQNMLAALRNHIYEVSGSIDLKQLSDTAAARVFTIKASLMRLENNCKTTENYFHMALNKQFDLWCYWLKEYNQITLTSDMIDIDFTRNFISDEVELSSIEKNRADTLAILMNSMSPADAYAELGYDKPEEIAKRYIDYQLNGVLDGLNI